jgi:hypothetical protein
MGTSPAMGKVNPVDGQKWGVNGLWSMISRIPEI